MTQSTDTQGLEELSPGVFVDAQGEIIHDGPCAVRQNYAEYTEEEHGTWEILYTRQWDNLQDIAYEPWLEAIKDIGLCSDRIPKLSETTRVLQEATGWVSVPVSGFLSAKDYFIYLSKRQFPTVPQIRARENIDFVVEPEIFHDGFGHLPMHTHASLADFIQLFGRTALAATEEWQLKQMERLYWFSVEYCLISTDKGLKVCGSGHLSGIQESRYSLTDAVEKKEFRLPEVCEQDYNPHKLQPVMFVIDSYEQVYDAMRQKAEEWGVEP